MKWRRERRKEPASARVPRRRPLIDGAGSRVRGRSRTGCLPRSCVGFPGLGRSLLALALSRGCRRRGGVALDCVAGRGGGLGTGAGCGGNCRRYRSRWFCRHWGIARHRWLGRNCPCTGDGAGLGGAFRRGLGGGRRISWCGLLGVRRRRRRLWKIRRHDVGAAEKGHEEKNDISGHESESHESGSARMAQSPPRSVKENRAGCRHRGPLGGTCERRHNGKHRRRAAKRIPNLQVGQVAGITADRLSRDLRPAGR